MTRSFLVAPSFALALSACGGTPDCEELLSGVVHDGGFDRGLECWEASGDVSVQTEGEDDALESWIRAEAPADGSAQDSIRITSNRFSLEDREPMTLRFRARADAQRRLWIDMSGVESGYFAYGNAVTVEPTWQETTLTFESNAEGDDVVLEFRFGEQPVGMELDDVRLTRE